MVIKILMLMPSQLEKPEVWEESVEEENQLVWVSFIQPDKFLTTQTCVKFWESRKD